MQQQPLEFFKDIFIPLLFIGGISWLLSLVWLGWLGNAAVWLWAKSKNIKMKNPTHDILLHTLSPLAGLIPLVPAAAGQILILYAAQKTEQRAPALPQKEPAESPAAEERP